ncbi:hypothetical protein [Anthocerotibacter panamensis]|uniref:hypothetical protein n=1 Tax=Anthocerotibacter panamensis TaxID=2857077 RepID=UPI001C402F51|nr:hypothetical protein [Anthocerotibacter panamensis]
MTVWIVCLVVGITAGTFAYGYLCPALLLRGRKTVARPLTRSEMIERLEWQFHNSPSSGPPDRSR